MIKTTNKKFSYQFKLSSVGDNGSRFSYEITKNTNALLLVDQAANTLCYDFVGHLDDGRELNLKLDAALFALSRFNITPEIRQQVIDVLDGKLKPEQLKENWQVKYEEKKQ